MSRDRWHILREDDALILARHLPARFDVSAETLLSSGSRSRIAHQVRQDLWRRLQNLRGFSPVVRVERCDAGLRVTAGGSVHGNFPKRAVENEIADLLAASDHRARWSRFASHREVQDA